MMQDISPTPKQGKRPGKKVTKDEFRHKLYIESYGVKIGFSTNSAEALKAVREAVKIYLPDCFTEIEETETEHNFLFVWNKSQRDTLYKNGEKLLSRVNRKFSVEGAASHIRLTVAEFAVGRVFIHSGVIAWKGKAIIIPAQSLGGKTSLTAELIRRGALYFSDEYAILDEEGFVHPFPKTLSVRESDDHRLQVERSVETFGGKNATAKAPIGMFLLTQYKPEARWNPKILTPAKGILEIIKHTVPIRANPVFTLEVLNRAVNGALIVKSNRGDVSKSANQILDFFEKNCF